MSRPGPHRRRGPPPCCDPNIYPNHDHDGEYFLVLQNLSRHGIRSTHQIRDLYSGRIPNAAAIIDDIYMMGADDFLLRHYDLLPPERSGHDMSMGGGRHGDMQAGHPHHPPSRRQGGRSGQMMDVQHAPGCPMGHGGAAGGRGRGIGLADLLDHDSEDSMDFYPPQRSGGAGGRDPRRGHGHGYGGGGGHRGPGGRRGLGRQESEDSFGDDDFDEYEDEEESDFDSEQEEWRHGRSGHRGGPRAGGGGMRRGARRSGGW